MKILALPGLDGTGDLFRWFAGRAPDGITVDPVTYPEAWQAIRAFVGSVTPE